jgi:hypothetical protein
MAAVNERIRRSNGHLSFTIGKIAKIEAAMYVMAPKNSGTYRTFNPA